MTWRGSSREVRDARCTPPHATPPLLGGSSRGWTPLPEGTAAGLPGCRVAAAAAEEPLACRRASSSAEMWAGRCKMMMHAADTQGHDRWA